jgi:hypothetical protein
VSRLGLLLVGLLASCATDRYVGSIGRELIYSNRGYGFTARLATEGFDQRWAPIDPRAPEGVAVTLRPQLLDEPIDLDGDGELSMSETVRRYRPMLRLVSKTSSAARIDVDVVIVGGKNSAAPLDSLLELRRQELGGERQGAPERIRVAPEFDGLLATNGPTMDPLVSQALASRVALIDQPGFGAEGSKARRQVVEVTLRAPRLDPELIADQDRFLRSILLNHQGGPESAQEKW